MIFSVPCLFGLEGLVGNELRRLGMGGVTVENGRVLFEGDFSAMARANLNLRTGERVLLRLGRFPATSFEMLFEAVRALPLADFIPKDGAFPVKGHCLNSQLHSVPDCQRIIKKAASVNLGSHYHLNWLPESGAVYQLQFSIMKDVAELYLDTTGVGLHKRGYRAVGNDAPLRETLAAAMVELARYRGKEIFLDPFCGSGTICIEAALTACNRAPGMGRNFAAQKWDGVPQSVWQQARTEAMDHEFRGDYQIHGSDCDPKSLQGRHGQLYYLLTGGRHQADHASGTGRTRHQSALWATPDGAARRAAALPSAWPASQNSHRLAAVHHHL